MTSSKSISACDADVSNALYETYSAPLEACNNVAQGQAMYNPSTKPHVVLASKTDQFKLDG